MSSLRKAAVRPLLEPNAKEKATTTLSIDTDLDVDANDEISLPGGIPGRPAKPKLVEQAALKRYSLRTMQGRAALIHSIAHIELNAIDLALDIVCRFSGMPEQFYRDWIEIAKEEAKHFVLLREHLVTLGFDYGDFDAHNALWEMAERTKGDILARIALVPRTLEARGLDASPAVKNRLIGAGDHKAGEILDLILREEIGHVAAGNRWYRYVCAQRGLDPISTYSQLAIEHKAPKLKAPFNMNARRLAGFSEVELAALANDQ